MLRRRVFLHPEVIAASRNFVNVRLNVWLDRTNYERLHTLIGGQYANTENNANTAFAMFEPTAPGMTADSFPREPSIFYGSRVGRLYPVCLQQPMVSREQKMAFVRKRRLLDLGETEVDPELMERILWECENGRDAPSVAKIMNDLAARFPVKESASESHAVLPLMVDPLQAINFCAVDSRGVVAIVEPAEGDSSQMIAIMSRLLFEEGIAGRVHSVKSTAAEWAAAKSEKVVLGGELTSGVKFLWPETFGRNGEVKVELPVTASEEEIRAALLAGLADFSANWRKLDRKSHLKVGMLEDMTWNEYDPVTGKIVDITTQEKRERNRLEKELREAEAKKKAEEGKIETKRP